MYEDIIKLPHHVSPTREPMSMLNRAAQFSPFAALTGYDEAVKESARNTDDKLELNEDAAAYLDMKQTMLKQRISEEPEISVTYFLPDKRKTGGEYATVKGRLKCFDLYKQVMILSEGTVIHLADIINIESEIFPDGL